MEERSSDGLALTVAVQSEPERGRQKFSDRPVLRGSSIEIFTERRARIFFLRKPPPLEFGNDIFNKLSNVVHCRITAAQYEAAIGPGLEMQLLQRVRDLFWRAGGDQYAIDQKTPGELFERLIRIRGLQQFFKAAKIALLRSHLVGKIYEPHARPGGRKIDFVLGRHFHKSGLRRNGLEIAPLLFLGIGI